MKDVNLKVAEAIQDDVNKGIVRIDSSFMRELDVRPGDIVELEGVRKTVAIVDRAYPGDIGLNIIRMDGLIRKNSKTSIGELVKVRKTKIEQAKKVVIAPAKEGIVVRASPNIFKQGLLGRAILKGDIISLGGARRRRTTMGGSPIFDEVFSMIEENAFGGFGFGDLKFVVADTSPSKQAVIITEATDVVLNPEAINIKEETFPEVSYEDIGGLEDEIKKIREMIELPLKHPEIFERLGVEPPKGVLLHGPPGTGKTLLAKAVASETNAHFISINGPEVMSKFYGQSLPFDEKVLVSIDGFFDRICIGELVEKQPKNVKVVCFDKLGKVVLREVSDFIKHKTRSKLVEIKTVSGRRIKVTDDHSVFTIGNSGIESVKTSDLIAGKSFIAVPKKIPEPENSLDFIDFIDLLKEKDFGITIRNVQHLLKYCVKILGSKKVAELIECNRKYVSDIISKNVGVRVSKFVKLMDFAKIRFDKSSLQVCTKGKALPAVINLSEEFCTFLGLWIAEGSYTSKNEVRLSINKSELKYFEQLITKLFGTITINKKPNSNGADIIICSGVLGKLMRNVLNFNPGSRFKKVPKIIYNLNKKNLAAFLRGYVSGDGSVNAKTPAPMIELSTESPELADDIVYLLLRFGIVAKIYLRPERQQRRICFADFDNLEAFKNIGFVQPEKNKLVFDYVNTKKFSRRDQLPIAGIVKEIVHEKKEFNQWKNSVSVGRNVLLQLKNQKLDVVLNSDIYWDKVLEIKECINTPAFVYDISVPECENFISGFGGIFAHNSEENIRKKFEEAEKNAPAIIFIDEIDAIATKREETRGEVERRVVAQLLTLMDGLKSRGKVVVIAATNVPNILDPALRRPGRFDRELEISVPNKIGRLNILKIHTRNMPLAKDVDLEEFASVTHGFVGADLAALAKESAMIVLRKVLPDLKYDKEEAIPDEVLEKLVIAKQDFRDSLKVVRPSALREVFVEIPNVKWDDIGGLNDMKQQLKEAVEWPLKHPDSFLRLGVKPPKGILLYGAPGTGKTLLAKAVANESEANFISVKGPEIYSKWVGDSEKAVREVFKKARQTAPTIIFFDEIDALAPRRGLNGDSAVTERVVNQLLTEMDGLENMHDVVVIGATNRPDILDTALLRPGRFDRIILTPTPDCEARFLIFKVHTKSMPLIDVNLMELAEKTEGYVGADIEAICREAAILSLRENINSTEVNEVHFFDALKKVRPSVSKDVEKVYEDLQDQFSSARAKQLKEEKPAYFN